MKSYAIPESETVNATRIPRQSRATSAPPHRSHLRQATKWSDATSFITAGTNTRTAVRACDVALRDGVTPRPSCLVADFERYMKANKLSRHRRLQGSRGFAPSASKSRNRHCVLNVISSPAWSSSALEGKRECHRCEGVFESRNIPCVRNAFSLIACK